MSKKSKTPMKKQNTAKPKQKPKKKANEMSFGEIITRISKVKPQKK